MDVIANWRSDCALWMDDYADWVAVCALSVDDYADWVAVYADRLSVWLCTSVWKEAMKAVESPALCIIWKDVNANRLSVWQTIAGQIEHGLIG